ncbi:MAG: Verru_Chthon cassette protein A, partial [Verrucomicrobiota bacterium]
EIHIEKESGMDFSGIDVSSVEFLGFTNHGAKPFGGDDTFIWATNWAKPLRTSGARAWGGLLSFGYTMSARQANQEGRDPDTRELRNPRNVWNRLGVNSWSLYDIDTENGGSPMRSRVTPLDKGYDNLVDAVRDVTRDFQGVSAENVAQSYRYDLVTVPFRTGTEVVFNGGTVNFRFFDGGEYTENSAPDDGESNEVQEIGLQFPPFTLDSPFPSPGHRGHVNDFNFLGHDSTRPLDQASLTADPANIQTPAASYARQQSNHGYKIRGNAGSRSIGRMSRLVNFWDSRNSYIHANDIVQAVGVPHGDMRLIAAQRSISAGDTQYFAPHRDYGSEQHAHAFTNSVGRSLAGFEPGDDANKQHLILPELNDVRAAWDNGRKVKRPPYNAATIPLPFFGNEIGQPYGDFDNGAGTMIDGPYINKPDEGNVHALKTKFEQRVFGFWESKRDFGEFPYFSNPELAESGGPAYFSPNRLVSGPGMFGSLPTGVTSDSPWQTLLFRAPIEGNGYNRHPGSLDPPDALIMDMFWMPVVEPYAISEPLSTAGKVNMNYEMMPFMHVTRNTALRGVFRSEYMACIPVEYHATYKLGRGRGVGYHWRDDPRGGNLQGKRLRSVIKEIDTLAQFDTHFNNGEDVFKSSSEICNIHLIPQELNDRLGQPARFGIGSYTPTLAQMEDGSYWRDHSLVGDNSRERPYTNIQQRLTTKSNTFKVHYRTQVLKQARRDSDEDSAYETWNPLTDSVQAEYRGSSIVERFIDPNDPELTVDFATSSTARLDEFYQYRVVNPRRFAP